MKVKALVIFSYQYHYFLTACGLNSK